VDKHGEEFYQVTLGGSSSDDASIGKIVGPAFSGDRVADAVETIVTTYLEKRSDRSERFIDTYRRIGIDPFKEALYGPATARRPAAE
jgi:sulfite reductase (NADPH) hemoprotein beta-component